MSGPLTLMVSYMVFIKQKLLKESISAHFILPRLVVLVSESDFITTSAQLAVGYVFADFAIAVIFIL